MVSSNKYQEEKSLGVRMMERDRGLLFHTGLSDKVASEQRTEPSDAEVMKPHKENSGGGGGGHHVPRL